MKFTFSLAFTAVLLLAAGIADAGQKRRSQGSSLPPVGNGHPLMQRTQGGLFANQGQRRQGGNLRGSGKQTKVKQLKQSKGSGAAQPKPEKVVRERGTRTEKQDTGKPKPLKPRTVEPQKLKPKTVKPVPTKEKSSGKVTGVVVGTVQPQTEDEGGSSTQTRGEQSQHGEHEPAEPTDRNDRERGSKEREQDRPKNPRHSGGKGTTVFVVPAMPRHTPSHPHGSSQGGAGYSGAVYGDGQLDSPPAVNGGSLAAGGSQPEETPRVRVRVRGGSSGSGSGAGQAGGRPPVNLAGVTVTGGRDDDGDDDVGGVGGAAMALTADDRQTAEAAQQAFGDQGGEAFLSEEQDDAAADALDALANGEPLSEEQVDILWELAETPMNLPDADAVPNVWDRLRTETDIDVRDLRGAIFTGLQEQAAREAAEAGQPAGSVPVHNSETNFELAAFRDFLEARPDEVPVSEGVRSDAIAGIEAALRGEVMSPEQSDAVTAVAAASSTQEIGLFSVLRGSLFMAVDANDAALAASGGGDGTDGDATPGEQAGQGGQGRFARELRNWFSGAFGPMAGGNAGFGGGISPSGPVEPTFVEGGVIAARPVVGGSAESTLYDAVPPAGAPAQTAPDLDDNGTASVEPSTPAAPEPGEGEAKYDRRYLSVKNDTAGKLTLYLQYETISTGTGEWTWYPCDPSGTEAVTYELEAGQEAALSRDDWQLNARRVRIWAVAESGEAYDQFRGEDLWLVEEQPGGQRFYIAREVKTFPMAFGEPAAEE